HNTPRENLPASSAFEPTHKKPFILFIPIFFLGFQPEGKHLQPTTAVLSTLAPVAKRQFTSGKQTRPASAKERNSVKERGSHGALRTQISLACLLASDPRKFTR